jgi:hypothetical protein
MSNFRTKLLGLAALATLFAGASYGQGITGCTNVGVVPGPTNMRAEGTTELAGAAWFHCNSSVLTASVTTVSVFATAPVTSQLLSTNTPGQTFTEATLFICPDTAVNTANATCTSANATEGPFQGTVNGTQITFAGATLQITTGGGFSGIIYDVRMNANAVTIGTTLTTATETILASTNNTSGATLPNTVGFIFPSLVAPSFIPTPNGGLSPTITPYTACAGGPFPFPPPTPLSALSFGLTVGETFGGAFKVGVTGANSEGGPYQPSVGTAGTPGTATFGTKIQIVINNVATGMTIYVPTFVTNALGGGNTLTLSLVASAAAPDPLVQVPASTVVGAPAAVAVGAEPFHVAWAGESSGASAGFTPSNGTVTIVYEVAASNPSFIQSVVVPVFVQFGGNLFTTPPAQLTVLESYAPTAAAAAATTIPNFAPPSNAALPATTVTLCQTSLLFPFVTNQLGFDTGISIANTTTDIFHTTPVPGNCTLNFYGAGAPTPSTGVAAPGGTQASGTTNAFLLSSVAPGFQGYMIAQCNYIDGYGFAYIVYNLTQNSGVAMGYLAPEMTGRPVAGLSILGN